LATKFFAAIAVYKVAAIRVFAWFKRHGSLRPFRYVAYTS